MEPWITVDCKSNCNTNKHIISLFWSIRPTHLRRIKNLSNLQSLLSIWSACLEMTGGQHVQTPKYTWKQEPHRCCWTTKTLKASGLETDSPSSYHLWREVENSWTLSRGQQQFYSPGCSFQTVLRQNCGGTWQIFICDQLLADLSHLLWHSSATGIISHSWCQSVLTGIKDRIYDLVYWCFGNEKGSESVKQIGDGFQGLAHVWILFQRRPRDWGAGRGVGCLLSAVVTEGVSQLHEGCDGWMYTHGQLLWWVSWRRLKECFSSDKWGIFSKIKFHRSELIKGCNREPKWPTGGSWASRLLQISFSRLWSTNQTGSF